MKKFNNILLTATLAAATMAPAHASMPWRMTNMESATNLMVPNDDPRQRTPETIVQDVLALLPLQNQADFNREMESLAKAAPRSIQILAGMLQPVEKAANNKVEYAIGGVVAYASSNAKYKKAVLDGLQMAAPRAIDQTARQFLQTQMRLLGEVEPVEFTTHEGISAYTAFYDKLNTLGDAAGVEIAKAVKSKDRAYRMQALKYATAHGLVNDALAKKVAAAYGSAKEDGKVDILNWLGDNKVASQQPLMLKALKKGGAPALAAIEALGKVGGADAADALVAQLGGANSDAAYAALRCFKGGVAQQITDALQKASGSQLSALLALASDYRIKSAAPRVFELAETNPDALKALAGVVGKDDVARISQMLSAADKGKVVAYQQALKASIQALPAKEQYQVVVEQMKDASAKERFYPILASTNTDESVATLEKLGTPAAIEALKSSTNLKAASPLLKAAKAGDQSALQAYVKLVNAKQSDADARYENLAAAMQLAQSKQMKNTILESLGNVPTRNAFLLAGKYLDDKDLAYTAAVAEKLIANKTSEDIEYAIMKENLTKASAQYKAHGTADDGYAVDEIKKMLSELEPAPVYQLTEEEKKAGFELLFDGTNLDNFVGNKVGYVPINGCINVTANYGNESNLYTAKEYRDFVFRFEFCFLRPGVNNGVGVRTPMGVDAAYDGMCEVQILDHDDPIYAGLREYQVHGSVYGVIPAKRIKHKPLGEWSYEEIRVQGNHITVTVNGEVIVDGDIKEACQGHNVAPDGSDTNPYTVDHRNHPGMFNQTGHIGFLGHGAGLKLRNVRVLDLSKTKAKGKRK